MKGSHDWSSAVAADAAGNIFVGGQTAGNLFADAQGTGQDIWVAKLDGEGGELIWGYQVRLSANGWGAEERGDRTDDQERGR